MTTPKLTETQREMLKLINANGPDAHIQVGVGTEDLLVLMAAGLVPTPTACWHVSLTDAGRRELKESTK